jgi:tyrosyl-tRNA synthetase
MDYLHLFDNHGVTLQLGGSDQWGNCLSGVELIRKTRGAETHVITLPLVINKATGKKFGKSEDGAVWLDENKTSAFKFYQFWINADDEGVEDYLKIYTELDRETIEGLMAEHRQSPESRIAQKRLAFEVTKIVHGEEKAKSVENVSGVLFGGEKYENLNGRDFDELEKELPVINAIVGETQLTDILADGGLASSKTEARRFLEENAVYINGSQISLNKNSLDTSDMINGYAVIRRGKNSSVLVKVQK